MHAHTHIFKEGYNLVRAILYALCLCHIAYYFPVSILSFFLLGHPLKMHALDSLSREPPPLYGYYNDWASWGMAQLLPWLGTAHLSPKCCMRDTLLSCLTATLFTSLFVTASEPIPIYLNSYTILPTFWVLEYFLNEMTVIRRRQWLYNILKWLW